MWRRVALLGGVAAAAAVGRWMQMRQRRLGDDVGMFQAEPDGNMPYLNHWASVEVDDDEVAEIIRRARPALERARELY